MTTGSPSRRNVLTLGGATLALVACGDKGTLVACCDTGDTGDTSGTDVDWATGGTAAMSGDYADPFETSSESTCAMVCAMTLGPCYGETVERRDISEGYGGLPMRLALRIVDEGCEPVAGMVVDIWHAAPNGLYSGADTAEMCTEGDAEMTAGNYFRGRQTTDANGRVDFDTCFPGWYSSRAIHIHFQVRTGANEGSGEHVTSQLFFDEALIEDIHTTHPDYLGRGRPRTSNDEDKVLGDNDPTPYTPTTARQADGALLAWKTIVIRASLASDLCEAPESA
ncbi:MAG: protocatechuate 3,4-dioxygenase [Myxococcota bacterium]